MTWEQIADTLGLAALAVGSLLCLSAAIGINRLPDFFSRMHAATKPQVLGVLLVLLAVGLRQRSGLDVGMLILVGVFQMLTVPASGQMMARAYHRVAGSDPGPGVDDTVDRVTEREETR